MAGRASIDLTPLREAWQELGTAMQAFAAAIKPFMLAARQSEHEPEGDM